ncbi:MAG: hypothetical protein ACSHXA_17390 [Polaribacter sp.]|uniref:hypothetical protein n=1 Tax=Polaribacter sp. TaxID=1920175 RepID=UPI003EF56E25
MKNISKILVLFLVVVSLFTACEDENNYTPPFNEVSSLTWWVSPSTSYDEVEKELSIKKYISFKDLSRGVVSHEWKIPATAKFLSNNITETDSIFSNFILPDAGLSTTDNLANVLFTETGVHEVFLVNTFTDSVAESVNENGVWKVNKKFTITVVE